MTPGIFDWLDLQTMNELIILSLMVVVAAINMITALLILI
jgi:lipoprotein-releasing system permease protein